MKIEQNKKDMGRFTTLPRNGVNDVRRGAESSFEQELSHRQGDALQMKMKEILKEIDQVTEKLNRSITIQDLMVYKKLVKNFLMEATAQAYHIDSKRSRSRRGRTIMITVQTIDQEVDEILKEFIGKGSDPMDILSMLDKIRGMLVDLMI